MPGPQYRASTSVAATSSVASVSLTIPAAVVVGDVMVASCLVPGPASKVVATPTGWTLIRDDDSIAGGFHQHQTLFYKVAASGDVGGATTVLFDLNPNNSWLAATLVAYSGVDPTTPIQAQGAALSTVYGTTLTSPSVVATGPNTQVVEFFGATNSGGSPMTLTGPATVRENVTEFNNVQAVCVSDQPQAAAGASGTTAATTAVNVGWVAQTIILAPVGGGGGGPVAAPVSGVRGSLSRRRLR